jgi:hypothetical protein
MDGHGPRPMVFTFLIEPRKAAVALVISVVPLANYPLPPSGQTPVQAISIQI